MISLLPHKLEDSLRSNPVVSELLKTWRDLDLPNCWLVAGTVVQSYWNTMHEFPPLHGVSDVDLIYFDPNDLTEETEVAHASRISDFFDSLPVSFDVKNEARVHLWYESRFGYPIRAYTSAENAIDTFPTTAGAIGIRPTGDAIDSYASFGFDDLMNLVVRPNKRQITRRIYDKKVARWKSQWPMLNIIEWDDE